MRITNYKTRIGADRWEHAESPFVDSVDIYPTRLRVWIAQRGDTLSNSIEYMYSQEANNAGKSKRRTV
jgi:hypothetical protein